VQNTIYIYTTKTYQQKGWYKVGQTKNTAEERVKQQDGTSNPEELKLITAKIVPAFCTDKKVHKVLETYNNCHNIRKEWFHCNPDDVLRAINEVAYGIPRTHSFTMRPHQQECHDKVIKAFSNGYDEFLIGAIMRFGKTFTSYQIMKTLGSDLTFVVTYKTNDVVKAWREEIENHVDFKDYRFLNVKDCNLDLLQSNKKVVVFVSVPYLLNDAGAKDKSWIYKLKPDLVIVDEQHYGSATPKFREIIEKLNPTKRIDLSGTPYKALMRGSYPDECVYRWDSLPIGMNLFVIDLAKEVTENSELAGFIDEDGFHINKFFAADKNGFIFHRDVESAMIKLIGKNPFEKNKHLFSPFCIREIDDKQSLNHILMRLESVDSAIAMEKMLTDMLPDYKIIRAAGSDSLAIKDADKLQSIISKSNKSITITVGRFETGVTIPLWGTVMPLHAGSSPESYTQTAYRASSECKTDRWAKKSFNVIDPDPHRAFEVVYTSRRIMKKKGASLKESFEDFFDCANVYVVDENRFVKLTSDQLIKNYETFLSKRDPASEIRSEYGMNNLRLSASAIVALTGINATKAKNISLLMTNNDLPKGKIKKRAQAVGLKSEEKEVINDLIEKMKTVCSRIPIVVIANEYVDLDSLLGDVNNKTFFKKVTGVTIDDYRDMLSTGALNMEWQDRAIARINNLLETIKPERNKLYSVNFSSILSLYSNMGNEASPGTPMVLASDMLDKLPSNIWSDPNKTFLEPSFSSGGIYFKIIEKLYSGLEEAIPNPKERLKHILTKQVWAYEMNEIPYVYVRKLLYKQFGFQEELDVELNLYYNNILEEQLDMKFDVIVMNPPYQAPQEASGKRGGGDLLWHKFVEASINKWAKEDGYICAVHPSGWRKPESDRSKYKGMFPMMTHDHHMQYLEIHGTKDGMKTFGAGTRYDWYVIAKGKTGKTTIKDQNGTTGELDLTKHGWLPNHSFDKVYGLTGDSGTIIYDRGAYGTDKSRSWTKKEKDQTFKYPLVHTTTKKGNKFWYTSRTDKGHFGIPKIMFGESGINDCIIDVKGEYGMTQQAMALPIKDHKDGLKAKEYLMSEDFKNILNACSWSNFRIDWRMFTYFKEGFWRD